MPISPLRIVLPGGTGRLGLMLARHFHEQGHAVSTITRFPKPRPWEAIHWDGESMDAWASSLDGADVVANFAGRSLAARAKTTALIGEAIAQCSQAPRVWLNATGDEFEVGSAPHTRKIWLRLAAVMTPESGAFTTLLRMVRWGLGGQIGSGDQYIDWVHDLDFVRAIEFLIEHEKLEGKVDIASPCPLPNRQFMCNLRRAWCTSYLGLPSPACLLTGLHPEVILKSSRVVSTTLLEAGFSFRFPEWRGACENLVQRWRQLREA